MPNDSLKAKLIFIYLIMVENSWFLRFHYLQHFMILVDFVLFQMDPLFLSHYMNGHLFCKNKTIFCIAFCCYIYMIQLGDFLFYFLFIYLFFFSIWGVVVTQSMECGVKWIIATMLSRAPKKNLIILRGVGTIVKLVIRGNESWAKAKSGGWALYWTWEFDWNSKVLIRWFIESFEIFILRWKFALRSQKKLL